MSDFWDITAKLKELRAKSAPGSEPPPGPAYKDVGAQRIPVESVQVEPASRLITFIDPYSPGADRFRLLRLKLQELWNTGKLKTLLITSALPQEGKSTVALNLATSLAQGGKRVLLVEADLYSPSIAQKLGLQHKPGLVECLELGWNPWSTIRQLEPLGFFFISAGTISKAPMELQADAVEDILQKLVDQFDWILIDAPPVMPLTDAMILARQTDATLLVARNGRTPREAIAKAISYVGRQRVLGIVLNGIEGLEQLYSRYHGYYANRGGVSTQPALQPGNAIAYLDMPKPADPQKPQDGSNLPAVRNRRD
jgi:capsular exopolysaccharide synthesis family protein